MLLSCNPGAAAIHVTPWSVQSQMEVAWQPLVGEAGGCSDLVAGSALSRARSVLMTPSATRATFERTTLETPTTGSPSSVGTSTSLRHVHWRNAVDAGDGWHCSNCLRLARAFRCEGCGASKDELAPYAAPGELASVMADAARCSYGRGLKPYASSSAVSKRCRKALAFALASPGMPLRCTRRRKCSHMAQASASERR